MILYHSYHYGNLNIVSFSEKFCFFFKKKGVAIKNLFIFINDNLLKNASKIIDILNIF